MIYISEDDIRDVVLHTAYVLRQQGVKVGTSGLVQAERIIRDYVILSSKRKLSADEMAELLVSVWPSAMSKKSIIQSEIERVVSSRNLSQRANRLFSEVMNALGIIGVKPGERIYLKKILKKSKKEKIKIKSTYMKLRRIGVIRGKKGKERIADTGTLRKITLDLARQGYGSIDDALRNKKLPTNRDEILSHLESKVDIGREQIQGVSESQLLKIGWAALKKHNYKAQKLIASVLKEKIINGEPIRDPESVLEYLRRTHSLTSDILVSMLGKGIPVGGLSTDTIARIIKTMNDELAGTVISKYRKILPPEEYKALIEKVDPKVLWSLEGKRIPGDDTGIYQALSTAAKAFHEAVMFASTQDPGRADMALYYAEKAEAALGEVGGNIHQTKVENARSLIQAARNLVTMVDGFGRSISPINLASMLMGLSLEDAVSVMRSLYKNASSKEERELLVSSMDRLLARLVSRAGLVPLGKRVYNTYSGRLEVRRSLYNMLRQRQNPLVFARKAKTRPLGLALDVSSSMIPFSSWALAVASMFSRHLERIVLFSHESLVWNGPFSRREIARILLSAEFGGRTNISLGLRAAAERLFSRRLIVVTDLSQTVDDDPPWETARLLRQKGIRVVFVVHDRFDREVKRLLELEQVRVLVVSSPRDAARHIVNLLR